MGSLCEAVRRIVAVAILIGGAMAKGAAVAGRRNDATETETDSTKSREKTQIHSYNNETKPSSGKDGSCSIQPECGLWLAPSTIPDSGLGMFAGRDVRKGQDVGSGDIVIAIWELDEYHPDAAESLLLHYTWDAWVLKLLGKRGPVKPSVHVWSPGLGAATNTNRESVNVRFRAPILDSTGLHQSRGPGAGAFTYHHNRRALASSDIAAGQELFVDYGEAWFYAHGLESAKSTGHVDKAIRDQTWLREHGACGDHLVPGTSSISHAGRGAFARRHLPVGTLVAQLPLVHMDRSLLDMVSNEGLRQQLLLNYCFGHQSSTLLLCPYGPVASLINHGPSRRSGNSSTAEDFTANVHLQWSIPTRSIHDPSLLLQPVEALLNGDKRTKLAMDLIATRDIAEGEEVLLDYGVEWEQAWQNHVKHWNTMAMDSTYRSAEHLNDETARVRTVFERLADDERYPENVELFCDNTFQRSSWRQAYDSGEQDAFLSENVGQLVPCDILRYQEAGDGTDLYTVAVYTEPEKYSYLLEGIPRQALGFRDVPYSTDDYLINAFRHDIRIPDELFPEAWRNR